MVRHNEHSVKLLLISDLLFVLQVTLTGIGPVKLKKLRKEKNNEGKKKICDD